jgi:O-antigen/teichoic acid export membrane protein
MYYLVTNYLFYERKTHITASVTLLCGSIGVFLTWWLVSIYGLIGAGVGAAVSMFLQFVITWIMANKVHPMPWLKFYKLA